MSVWIVVQKTDFCPSRLEEILFDCIAGVIYCFSFFNVKEGRTRWRLSIFYFVCLVENVLLTTLWYLFSCLTQPTYLKYLLLSAVFAMYLVGELQIYKGHPLLLIGILIEFQITCILSMLYFVLFLGFDYKLVLYCFIKGWFSLQGFPACWCITVFAIQVAQSYSCPLRSCQQSSGFLQQVKQWLAARSVV